jgi:hypothetical protein
MNAVGSKMWHCVRRSFISINKYGFSAQHQSAGKALKKSKIDNLFGKDSCKDFPVLADLLWMRLSIFKKVCEGLGVEYVCQDAG